VVNKAAQRFADEGENIWPKRYASWGQLISDQPGQVAYSIFESKDRGRFIPPLFPPFEADSISALASRLALDPRALQETITGYNAAAPDDGVSDLSAPDGRTTRGLAPPKSNWATRLRNPPYCAYPLRPGITFTYYSLAIDERARVLNTDGSARPGLYAAGEAMAGNVLSRGYLAGFGMTMGTVFGRIAGEEAAAHARERG
jgi:tricarballylate dehydrogenase